MPRRRGSKHLLVYLTVVLAVTAVVLWSLVLFGPRTEYLALMSTLIGTVTAMVTLFNTLKQNKAQSAPAPGVAEIVKQAGDQLCGSVRAEIEQQQNRLQVKRDLLDVRWRTVHGEDVPAEGDLATLVDALRGMPRRRLLILGAPASGKTVYAARLALEFINDRAGLGSIPVLLRFALWEPGIDLSQWIADQVEKDYAGALPLLAGDALVPILDGVDEVGPLVLPAALRELDRSLGDRSPLVVVCRTDLYHAAVEAGGPEFDNAWVIELRRLDRDAVVRYLAGTDRDRWPEVVAELEGGAPSETARVLRNPFNAWLMKRLYPKGNAQLGDGLQERLLSDFVPSVLGPAMDARPERLIRFTLPGAVRWLRFLARHLVRDGREDFAWWELGRAIPFLLTEAVVGVLAGALYGVLLLLAGSNALGVGVGAAFGVLFGLTFCSAYMLVWKRGSQELRSGGGGFRDNADLRTQVRRLAEGMVTVAIAWAVALGVVALWGSLSTLFAGARPAVLGVIGLGAVVSLIFGAAVGAIAALLLRMMTSYVVLATVRATTPRDALNRDRLSSIVCYLMFAVLVGAVTASSFAVLSTDPLFIVLTAVGGGITGGVTGAMMFFAWPPYQVRHAWLAVLRLTPWRLIRFLQVARDAGVLRQSGAHYQFRHKIVLDHLGTRQSR
ncbi:NACHT domain-containing protein [Kutzneria chonburiensis]|uniref:NACHT domain-containing protein n=1 Tax=Kutzneria chonburiensis TaxID=1483604 RepID=A0ABV6MS30_9PSEU|nr:hypothetical protein [Kutzneria chonburiensis]